MLTRRTFLQSSTLLALTPTVPLFLARSAKAAADKNGRVLVVVQLDGGNDALNTAVPIGNPAYEKLRPRLRIEKKDLVKLSDKTIRQANRSRSARNHGRRRLSESKSIALRKHGHLEYRELESGRG